MAKVGMFLETGFPPDPRVENEALSLIEHGHSVQLFNLDYSGAAPIRERVKGIEVFRYHAGRFMYKMSALVYTFPFYRWMLASKVSDFLKTQDLDVLHIHDMVLAETVIRENNGRLPLVLDLHENRPAIMKFYQHTNRFPGNALISLDEWERKQDELITRADHVITVTEEAKEHYLGRVSKSEDRFTVVPNTVNLKEFLAYDMDTAITERFKESFNLLYLGDTGLRRGLMTVIEALPELRKEIPNLCLIIVGSSSADHLLKSRVAELGVSSNVSFEGWQDMGLFPSYIKASHICLSPIHRNLHHDTTYANKIFQYMAIGRALLVSDCPPQAKVVIDHEVGLVHRAEDSEDLARCIKEMHADTQLREGMGSRAKIAAADKWNWAVTDRALQKLYQTIDTAN